MSEVDIDGISEQFVGVQYEERSFTVEAEKMAEYAKGALEETLVARVRMNGRH